MQNGPPSPKNPDDGQDVTIADLARLIAGVTEFAGRVSFDPTKLDGTPRKLMDVSRLVAMGWQAWVGLEDGLKDAYLCYRPQGAG